jgi:hypothetical protein
MGIYKPHESVVWLNKDDPDLKPIKVDILDLIQRTYRYYGYPEPKKFPDVKKIAGYSVPTAKQVFVRPQVPAKLMQLERYVLSSAINDKKDTEGYSRTFSRAMDDYWRILEEKQDEYAEELAWLERMWYHRLFGYWFFNNGTPTYMTGDCFEYLLYWTFKKKERPLYRDRDRRWFIAINFAHHDTTTFAKRDKDGWAIPEENGEYEMTDTGSRVSYGGIFSKPRRVGDTTKSACKEVSMAMKVKEGHFGNQAADDTSATRIFSEYINIPLSNVPLCFRPVQKRVDPSSEIRFESEIKGMGLGSWISYSTTKYRGAYDGATMDFYYGDEVGKIKYESIKERHGTVKLALSERDIIKGLIIYTTTIEEMTREGGTEFLRLSKDSMYHQRTDNGQTKSGMYVFFFSATDGHPNFVDRHGMSVIETPNEQQRIDIKKKIGAKEHLMAKRKFLKDEDLALEKRQNPIIYRECFTPPVKNIFFNVTILEEKATELQFSELAGMNYDLVWESARFGNVREVPNENGRFCISRVFGQEEKNRWTMRDGVRYPMFPDKYIACGDAFRLEKTEGGKYSLGGGAVRWLHDPTIDPPEKDVAHWESARLVITYRFRPPTTDEYVEDMLKMCILTGAMMYPEMNYDIIAKKFIEWGFGGYLLHDTDVETGVLKVNPGFTTIGGTKIKLFNLTRDEIQTHGRRCRHLDWIRECLDIKNMEDMTNYDLFTAVAGTLLGEYSKHAAYLRKIDGDMVNTGAWVDEYEY